MAVLALVGSMLIFGTGDMINLKSDMVIILDSSDVFWRYVAAFGFAALSMLTVSSLAFLLSVFAENSIGPIIGTMAIIIVFTILTTMDIPFFNGLKPFLFTNHMLHDPELIILDEPTNGLDPQGIADVRNLILHLSKNEGKTLVISSHLLSEIELIADSMLIIDKGRKIAEGKVNELLNPADVIVELQTTNNAAALKKLQNSVWQKGLKLKGEKILLSIHQQEIPALAKNLIAMDIEIMALQPKHSLEDYFLSLTTNDTHVAAYQY
jgi:hypothetical protein